ncbi:MAG: linear amide C-N hydrolase [Anaerolineales bacterium]|nr:linear amide C-N hydrolase [Anaerolineales bacterium]
MRKNLVLSTLIIFAYLLAGCKSIKLWHTPTAIQPTDAQITPTPTLPAGMTLDQAATLNSLEKIDDYPFYVMRYQGDYRTFESSPERTQLPAPVWACSLFAALADPNSLIYGRNFDWQFSPALLLFTDPPDGYASVSMVDIDYLGYPGDLSQQLSGLSLAERTGLLDAPALPFDGMNEHGLAIGMAAVPGENINHYPQKETIGSIGLIRQVLDRARTVDEALEILESYNIDMSGGPAIHYLVADRLGKAALAEFYQGELVITHNAQPWQMATNFLRASISGDPQGKCWRYDRIAEEITANQGRLIPAQAMQLLQNVSQENTQWSVVYDMSSGQVQVAIGRSYQQVYTFSLELASP